MGLSNYESALVSLHYRHLEISS